MKCTKTHGFISFFDRPTRSCARHVSVVCARRAPKTSIKVRLVPENKPDSPFFYYVKKPSAGEKAKIKLKAKKYNPSTRKHEIFVEKKLPPHSK